MINPITNINYQINGKYLKTNPSESENLSNPSSITLSGYEAGRAIFARNNVSFKNLSTPIEVTDRYNKPIEGKDHLDLPNIHVYEYPDTNLKVFMNIDDKTEYQPPQYCLAIEADINNYNPIKQALINAILFSKFKKSHLEEFYSYSFKDLCCNCQFISSGSNQPLKYEDISTFNRILTNTNFTNEDLSNAKLVVTNYFKSENYNRDYKKSNEFYKTKLMSKEDVIKEINNIDLNTIREYYKDYLQNSTINATLTLSNQDIANKKQKIFKNLNSDINIKFKEKENERNFFAKNNEINILHNETNNISVKFDYYVPQNDIKEQIILHLLPQLFLAYSNIEQERFNNYIDRTVENDIQKFNISEKDTYVKIVKNQISNNNFNSLEHDLHVNNIAIPIGLIYSPNDFTYGSYYQLYAYNGNNDSNININNLTIKQMELLNAILASNIDEILTNIKNDYKESIKFNIKDNSFNIVKNLQTANYSSDLFNIYETIDSINSKDIKDFINKYFIMQKPIIEICCPSNVYKDFIGE